MPDAPTLCTSSMYTERAEGVSSFVGFCGFQSIPGMAGIPRNAIILELTVILDFFGDLGAHETSILVHLGRLQTSNARKFQRKSHQHTLILQNWERYDGSFQYASDIRSGARLRPLPSSHELRELLSTSLSQQAQDRALR